MTQLALRKKQTCSDGGRGAWVGAPDKGCLGINRGTKSGAQYILVNKSPGNAD